MSNLMAVVADMHSEGHRFGGMLLGDMATRVHDYIQEGTNLECQNLRSWSVDEITNKLRELMEVLN